MADVLRVTAAVMAAGHSRRMGAANKLLLPVRGEPMVRHAVRAAQAAGCEDVLVILGHEAEQVRDALVGLSVRCVVNPHHAEGLASAVRCAHAMAAHASALLCLLGDMPNVQPDTLRALIEALHTAPAALACRPVCQGRPGNPVLWSVAARAALADLKGDEGARSVLAGLGTGLIQVHVEDAGVLLDIDTPDDLAGVS